MTELDAEDAKLVMLARGAMGRAEAGSGAAVRDAGRSHVRRRAGGPRRADADRAAGRGGRGGVERRDGSEAAVLVGGSDDDAGVRRRARAVGRTPPSSSRTGPGNPRSDRDEFRSGFVCFVGRPNTGKSTLTNALVGTKVAITSNRPQTTRHTIRGIVHRDDFQIVLVDTPGLHRPRTLLGQRLNELVKDTYSEVDVIGLCIPADETIGPGDRWIYEQIRAVAPRTTLVVDRHQDRQGDQGQGGRAADRRQRADRRRRRDRARCRRPRASRSTC